MQAIYPSTEKLSNKGVSNRVITKVMQQLFLETKGRFAETLSRPLIENLKLLSKSEAFLIYIFQSLQNCFTKHNFDSNLKNYFTFSYSLF